MAGRPQGQPPASSNSNLLLDLDEQPTYNSGQRAPVNDDLLFDHHDADSSGRPGASISYDNFVGASTTGHLGGPGASAVNMQPPLHDRSYSQTSELGNYQRYSDLDDLQDDQSMQGGYYASGGDDHLPGLADGSVRGHGRNRNSILSLGGGIVGKAKNIFGMAPGYSEMDLPLTETGARSSHIASGGVDALPSKPAKSKSTPGSKFKFGLGGKASDAVNAGPRLIHLNNPPANALNKYVDNHVSTAKYNVATFLPKFLFEQFSKYANLFFLFTAILQQIPNVSPTSRYTTIVPLGIVLLVSAAKEVIEDSRRKASDKQLNTSKGRVL